MVYSLGLSVCPVFGRPRGTAGGGVQAWAGRVSSGGQPRRRRRHAEAGPVAVVGWFGPTGRWPALALRALLHGLRRRALGTRAAQARPSGARVQGRRRARRGPRCGQRDQRQGRSVACGPRPVPGAWIAAGGRGGSGAMRVRGPLRPRGGAGGPVSPTPRGRRERRGHARGADQAAGGARARAPAHPMRARLWAAGQAARAQPGALPGRSMEPRRGAAPSGIAGAQRGAA